MKLLTVREAAQRKGVRLQTIYSALWAGRLMGAFKDEHSGEWQIPESVVTPTATATSASK